MNNHLKRCPTCNSYECAHNAVKYCDCGGYYAFDEQGRMHSDSHRLDCDGPYAKFCTCKKANNDIPSVP